MTRVYFCLMLALLLPCFAFSPRPAQAASAASRGAAQDIADLDRILARVSPAQADVFVDDMGFKTTALRRYRAQLAGRVSGKLSAHASFLPNVTQWPGGNVPYAFDANVSAVNQSAFAAACKDWEKVANVHFYPRTTEADYVLVHFQPYNNSYVGKVGGPQDLNLYNFNYEFIICHELGHALGLIHEHERSDRDAYITVNLANVISGMEPNFDIVPGSLNQGAYDFDSVMHYGPTAFSANGQPTMTVNAPYAAQYGNAIGQFSHLSVSDKAGMAAIYGPPSTLAPAAALTARLLWTKTDGAMSVWNVDTSGGYTHEDAPPTAGWTAAALVAGPDGSAHLLWMGADHAAGLETISAAGAAASVVYGPFTGWEAQSLAVGPDSLPRVLWANTGGAASLWSVSAAGGFTHAEYGPYAGWTAHALAADPDGTYQLLWNKADGEISLWTVSADGASVSAHDEYGPYAGWSVASLAVGPDGIRRLLWTRVDGAMALWTQTAGSSFTARQYGPYAGWAADSVSVGLDNVVHVLWSLAGGGASLWTVDSAGDIGSFQFGPYAGWQAVGLAGK